MARGAAAARVVWLHPHRRKSVPLDAPSGLDEAQATRRQKTEPRTYRKQPQPTQRSKEIPREGSKENRGRRGLPRAAQPPCRAALGDPVRRPRNLLVNLRFRKKAPPV